MDIRDQNAIARLLPYMRPTEDEIAFLSSLGGQDRTYRAGQTIGGSRPGRLRLLLEGWAIGAVVTQDGERRVHTVHLPGDMLQMAELVLGESVGWAEAINEVMVREFDSSQLWDFFTQQPRLAAGMFLIAQEERAARIEWFSLGVSVGAKRRLAALIYRIGERLERYKQSGISTAPIPLTQRNIAAFIGVTPVYSSKIVGELSEEGLIKSTSGGFVISDLTGLKNAAGIAPWNVRAPAWLPNA